MPEMFTLLNNSHKFTTEFVKQQFERGIRPIDKNSTIENVMIKAIFGNCSNNPFVSINDVVIVCDGTIYNSEKLFEELGIEPETEYDYEIIVHLYIRYGIETALRLIDGIYAFAILDHRLSSINEELDSTMYVARDPYGVKPMYLLHPNTKNIMIAYNKSAGDIYALSSNLDMLKGFEEELNVIEHPENDSLIVKGKPKKCYYVIDTILPGTYSVFEQKFRVLASWRFIRHQIPYHMCQLGLGTNNTIDANKLLQEAVVKRIGRGAFTPPTTNLVDDLRSSDKFGNKPVSMILTGNYEGFMTAAIANEELNDQEKYVNTFSFQSSTDDVQLVTDILKTNHTVVTVTDADIENEKENIDPAFADQVELWLMAKTIARVAPNSVVFLEIGIDKLDHLFDAHSHIDFQDRLLYYFKSICSDRLNKISKIFWHHGLEVQIPWLDNALVQHFVTNCKDVKFTFNPVGVYGNKLLPEELFI